MARRSRDELCDAGRFSSDPERSYSLPGRFYTDPEIFALEEEKVFFRTWQYVGPAELLQKETCIGDSTFSVALPPISDDEICAMDILAGAKEPRTK